MIHEIGIELQAQLTEMGVPFVVVDGPEPTKTTTWGRERIVVERDSSADSFSAPRSQHINPKHRRTRTMALKITIYAQSRVAGATVFEHRRRADAALDAVLVAMDVVAANRKNAWNPKSGSFITPDDLEGTERAGGAVYELLFTFDRGVFVRTWAGAIQPEMTLPPPGGITSTTKVSLANGPDASTPDTACGA